MTFLAVSVRAGETGGMIGRLHHLVIDCPDPEALATFYAGLLGLPITYRSPDFVVVSKDDTTSGLAFQRAVDYRAPTWPDPGVPQQMHHDVMVDDVEIAAAEVIELGARRVGPDHVYVDPAGHPFCLIPRPSWAGPIHR